jgi:catechol 2,3-dioxygenase-like lactoylglutathione lyase family enzyme
MKFSHFGLVVDNIDVAEGFYCRLFNLDVFVREVRTRDGWKSLEAGMSSAEAAARGFRVRMVVLRREGFGISLTEKEGQPPCKFEHVAFVMDPKEFNQNLELAKSLGCDVIQSTPHRFVFSDPFGVVWEIMDQDRLFSAKDMGYGWVSRSGTEYPSANLLFDK